MASVVRLEEGHAAFGFLFRNLTEDVFGEVVLKFTEGSHAIVDPIKEQKNSESREDTATKTNEESFE
jgi:hypothetical protein